VSIAVTSGIPKYEGELFQYKEVVRLQQDESNEESILFRASQYLMGEDGYFYVNDRGNTRIAVFGPDGKYVRSFGRDGDGPGEFRSPNLLWIRDNNVAVFDMRNRRTSLFNINGTFLRSFSYSKGGSFSALHPLQDGCMVVIDTDLSSIAQSLESIRIPMATVINAAGDTLSQVKSPPYSMGRIIELEEYRMGLFNAPYFSARSNIQYHPGKGILVYSTAEPEFKWYGLDGILISVIRVDMPPPPVTYEDRQAIEKMLDDDIQTASDDRGLAMAKLRKKHAIIPDVKSYWTSITVDDSGYYWLSGNPDFSAEGMERYHQPSKVLSPDGEYLGDTTLPETVMYLSRGHVLTYSEEEETGESVFVVYRIISKIEGLEYP